MKTLSSQYAQFTPEERLRLFLAAAERGDRPEVQRLLRTCPQMSLVGADPQFSTRAHWMQAAVSQVARQLLEASGYVLGNALLDGAPRKGRAAKPKGRATWKGWSTIWRGIDAGITKFCAETGLTGSLPLRRALTRHNQPRAGDAMRERVEADPGSTSRRLRPAALGRSRLSRVASRHDVKVFYAASGNRSSQPVRVRFDRPVGD